MEMKDDMGNPTENGNQADRLSPSQGDQGPMESSQPSSEGDNSPFPSSASIAAAVHKHQQAAGRAGGLSRSSAKREATRRNIAKARLSRWPGREAAATRRADEMEHLQPREEGGIDETPLPKD